MSTSNRQFANTKLRFTAMIVFGAIAANGLAGCGSGNTGDNAPLPTNTTSLTGEQTRLIEAERSRAKQMQNNTELMVTSVEAAGLIYRKDATSFGVKEPSRSIVVSQEVRDFAERSVEELNAQIRAGVVTADEVSLDSQQTRANERGVKLYWWGIRIALNDGQARNFARVQRVGLSGLSALVGGLIGGLGGAVAGAVIGQIAIEYVDWCVSQGRGVYLYYDYFSRASWMVPQP